VTDARPELERFRAVIAQRLGLEVDETKLGVLDELLAERIRQTRSGTAAGYLRRLDAAETAGAEARVLAENLTVGETYFFRHADSLRAFAQVAVPDCLRRGPRLRILSAGCSSGEEAYSLVMTLREQAHDFDAVETSVRAIDINPAALRKARDGIYTAWSLRETPAHLRARYFRPSGALQELDPEVRARVVFEERNLIEDDPVFFYPGAFDAIFCRNVTIYFAQETTRQVIARLSGALSRGGYLFLGHSENLRGISTDFHLCHSHGTFYYQRRDGEAAAPASPPEPGSRPAPFYLPDATGSWVDDIGRASARIARLAHDPPAEPAPAPAPPEPPAPPPPSAGDVALALSYLGRERFADALAVLEALPIESQRDVDVQLLRAVALVNAGQVASAERVCGELLAVDELNAGAHYLMALCRDQSGDRAGATRHDETAVYLAPGFAMPHLHLGLLARRAGDPEAARRALETAMGLLAREDASRILLFGGGFNRETLTQLCQSELRAVGRR
jgi:chemotaxis protein methyltransferase CheR